jgi:RHS repeat-associated protein
LSLRFPGQYFDAETGLFYNYFRDHDPQTGRYVQSDPIGLRGGPNTYLYVLADPLGLRDPLGLIACFYDPPNFDTTNCFLVSKSYTDRDFYQWRDTDVGQIAKIYIPKPRWGGGPPLPNPRLPPTQPPVRPTVQEVSQR